MPQVSVRLAWWRSLALHLARPRCCPPIPPPSPPGRDRVQLGANEGETPSLLWQRPNHKSESVGQMVTGQPRLARSVPVPRVVAFNERPTDFSTRERSYIVNLHLPVPWTREIWNSRSFRWIIRYRGRAASRDLDTEGDPSTRTRSRVVYGIR